MATRPSPADERLPAYVVIRHIHLVRRPAIGRYPAEADVDPTPGENVAVAESGHHQSIGKFQTFYFLSDKPITFALLTRRSIRSLERPRYLSDRLIEGYGFEDANIVL